MKIVHAAAKTSDFLKVFAEYVAIETDFAVNFCETCFPIFIEGQIVAKLESFANESRILFTDECQAGRRPANRDGDTTTQAVLAISKGSPK
jgi:hypothetical protein